jgi:hypothetical protein
LLQSGIGNAEEDIVLARNSFEVFGQLGSNSSFRIAAEFVNDLGQ